MTAALRALLFAERALGIHLHRAQREFTLEALMGRTAVIASPRRRANNTLSRVLNAAIDYDEGFVR